MNNVYWNVFKQEKGDVDLPQSRSRMRKAPVT